MKTPKALVRGSLISVGRRLPARALPDLRTALGYIELGQWLVSQPGSPRPRVFKKRDDLYAYALTYVHASAPLYLEFGVAEGESMRWWSGHLRGDSARLVGFDSFEGLPENWRPGLAQGHFATNGPPQIDDRRVSFEVGWFEKTLAAFDPPDHDQLIVNVDSDLYSSARTVLAWLEPHLRPGTLIYFDELPDHDHELRAFFESLAANERRVTPLGMAAGGVHWLLRYE
jgi:hypothetical protein